MAEIDVINQRLTSIDSDTADLKDKIEEIAENKNISVSYNTDTPLSLLNKIDNGTIKTPTGTLNITSNGTIDVTNYANADVLITPNLGTKSITEDGTYNASSDNLDGYSSVTVNVSGGSGSSELINVTEYPTPNNTAFAISFIVDNDNILFSLNNASSSGMNQGIYLFNKTTTQFSKIYSSGYYWSVFVKLNNGDVLISSGSNVGGLLRYDHISKTITSINTSLKWDFNYVLTNGNVLYGTSNGTGIRLYDTQNNTFTSIYSTGNNWRYFHELNNGNVLISSSSASTGILLYNISDGTCTQIFATGYNFAYSQNLPNNNMLISTGTNITNTGLMLYNINDDSVTLLLSGTSWGYFHLFNNICFVSQVNVSSANALYVYNVNTDTLNMIISGSYADYTFTELQNGNIFISYDTQNSTIYGGVYDVINATFSQNISINNSRYLLGTYKLYDNRILLVGSYNIFLVNTTGTSYTTISFPSTDINGYSFNKSISTRYKFLELPNNDLILSPVSLNSNFGFVYYYDVTNNNISRALSLPYLYNLQEYFTLNNVIYLHCNTQGAYVIRADNFKLEPKMYGRYMSNNYMFNINENRQVLDLVSEKTYYLKLNYTYYNIGDTFTLLYSPVCESIVVIDTTRS